MTNETSSPINTGEPKISQLAESLLRGIAHYDETNVSEDIDSIDDQLNSASREELEAAMDELLMAGFIAPDSTH